MATRKHLLCDGTGFYPIGSQTIDTICGGTGVVALRSCLLCDGTKFYPIGSETPCYQCDATGIRTSSGYRLGEDHFYSHEILNCINDTEYSALNDAKKDVVKIILSMGTIDMADNSVSRNKLFSFFPIGTTTRANLLTLLEEE